MLLAAQEIQLCFELTVPKLGVPRPSLGVLPP